MFHKFRQLIRFHKTIITVFSFFYICKIKIWHADLADFSRRLYSSDSLKVSKTLQKKRSKKKKRNYLAPIVVEILFCFFFKNKKIATIAGQIVIKNDDFLLLKILKICILKSAFFFLSLRS